jgi:sugar lactone lactonase YvrE
MSLLSVFRCVPLALAVYVCFFSSPLMADNVFVADEGAGKIYEFAPSGSRSTFTTNLHPITQSMAFDRNGNLFETDSIHNTIYKYKPDGTPSTFGYAISAFGLAFDSSGDLFVSALSGDGCIYRFAPNGDRSIFATGLSFPTGLAFDSDDNLYTIDRDSIYKFTTNGDKTTFATGLYLPYSLACDSRGNVYVSNFGDAATPDSANDCIYKYSPTGVLSTFATGLSWPLAMAFDSDGNLFTTDYAIGGVLKIAPNGDQTTFATGLLAPRALAILSVPEPSSLILFCIAATILLGYLWRPVCAANS